MQPKVSRKKEIINIRAEFNGEQKQNTKNYTTQSWLFEKINKIDKHLATLTKEKGEKSHINKIRSKRKEDTTDITEIQRIILEYYERLYDTKFNNLEEKNKLLDIYSLPRLNHEELKNLNRLINSEEIETNKNFPKNKSPGPDGFISDLYQSKKI